jgi:hypothetical protein
LKKHLLPRIKSRLGIATENDNRSDTSVVRTSCPVSPADDWQAVLLKHDRIYKHKLMRMNYTRYDVRRAEDVIHTGTTGHCNVMVLNPDWEALDTSDDHPFWYARVLGIYHANVMYIGKDWTDYSPHRIEFLWVWWYELRNGNNNWSTRHLDRVSFPPMVDENSFGFIDPDDVLRSCHIIPVLGDGMARQDGVGLSYCAQDHSVWKSYVINR